MSIQSQTTFPQAWAQVLCAVAGLLLLGLSGCDDLDKLGEDAGKRQPIMMPAEIVDAPGNVKPANKNPTTDAAGTSAAATANATPAATPAAATPAAAAPAASAPVAAAPAPNVEKAEAGVGAQGKDYGGGVLMAPITTPVREYFNMRERTNFDMIRHDLDIFHAINNRWPKNMEEFKKEIIEPGNRDLPDLPPGDVYMYDAKTGELFVQHNRQK